ncbi:flagellar hook-length control protein FliK [Campylobacter troglodytis]|uniref:flagellar hook-length control protein FliK n=1 Tax=Campylobacter troglodytis TaxID=654363 RepID=UPI001157F920|nr:flagellar hook-length control protein FliK [Campylobacter troglodytis]TQR60369.1 flagellar hook-length control protein FliK [Campylobacter troglodytis]
MINTQLLNTIANAKNDSNLEAKTQKSDEKSKEGLSQALKKNLGAISNHQDQRVLSSEELNLRLKSLVNKVLDQLFSKGSLSESLIKQGNKLNFAPNFSTEIKLLANEMKKSEIFADLLNKLETMLKPASELKANNLAPLFKNSGVFFEAKLKDALNPETLPKSFHSLLNSIKSLSSDKIATEIINLATKDLDPKSSLNALKEIITSHKGENQENYKASSFKTLLNLSSKLEDYKNYISKDPNLAQNKIDQIATKILNQLNKLESTFKQELRSPQSLALEDTRILKELNKGFVRLEQTLKSIINKDKIQPNSQKDASLNSQKEPNLNPQNKIQQGKVDKNSQSSQKDENVKQTNSLNSKEEKQTNPSNTKDEKIATSKAQEGTIDKARLAKEEANPTRQEDKSTLNSKEEARTTNKTEPLNSKQEGLEKIDIKEEGNRANNEDLDQAEFKASKDEKEVLKEESSTKQEEESLTQEDLKEEVKSKTAKNEPSRQENVKKEQATKDLSQFQKETQREIKINAPENRQVLANSQNTSLNSQETQPLLTEAKFTQPPQVKNLVFVNEKTQLFELENLSKELSNLGRKINEALKQLDPKAQDAKTNLLDLKNLENKMKEASKDLAKIMPKNEADLSTELKNDLKSTLLQVSNLAKNESNEAVANQANRLLAQIEFNQLMSLANDSINTYLPLFWEDLNQSRVIFKRGKKDKYFAQIRLNFARLGELDILIALKQDKYLDINIRAEDKEFRKSIYENVHHLKRALSKAGLLSSNFFVGDIIRSKLEPSYPQRDYDFQMGIDKKA